MYFCVSVNLLTNIRCSIWSKLKMSQSTFVKSCFPPFLEKHPLPPNIYNVYQLTKHYNFVPNKVIFKSMCNALSCTWMLEIIFIKVGQSRWATLLTFPPPFYVFAIYETCIQSNAILFLPLKVLLLIIMSNCFVSKLFFRELKIHVIFWYGSKLQDGLRKCQVPIRI